MSDSEFNLACNREFAGDNDETGVVHFCPHLIMQDDNAMSIDALEGGPGRFWHDIQ